MKYYWKIDSDSGIIGYTIEDVDCVPVIEFRKYSGCDLRIEALIKLCIEDKELYNVLKRCKWDMHIVIKERTSGARNIIVGTNKSIDGWIDSPMVFRLSMNDKFHLPLYIHNPYYLAGLISYFRALNCSKATIKEFTPLPSCTVKADISEVKRMQDDILMSELEY
jgi:hypothetical protein